MFSGHIYYDGEKPLPPGLYDEVVKLAELTLGLRDTAEAETIDRIYDLPSGFSVRVIATPFHNYVHVAWTGGESESKSEEDPKRKPPWAIRPVFWFGSDAAELGLSIAGVPQVSNYDTELTEADVGNVLLTVPYQLGDGPQTLRFTAPQYKIGGTPGFSAPPGLHDWYCSDPESPFYGLVVSWGGSGSRYNSSDLTNDGDFAPITSSPLGQDFLAESIHRSTVWINGIRMFSALGEINGAALYQNPADEKNYVRVFVRTGNTPTFFEIELTAAVDTFGVNDIGAVSSNASVVVTNPPEDGYGNPILFRGNTYWNSSGTQAISIASSGGASPSAVEYGICIFDAVASAWSFTVLTLPDLQPSQGTSETIYPNGSSASQASTVGSTTVLPNNGGTITENTTTYTGSWTRMLRRTRVIAADFVGDVPVYVKYEAEDQYSGSLGGATTHTAFGKDIDAFTVEYSNDYDGNSSCAVNNQHKLAINHSTLGSIVDITTLPTFSSTGAYGGQYSGVATATPTTPFLFLHPKVNGSANGTGSGKIYIFRGFGGDLRTGNFDVFVQASDVVYGKTIQYSDGVRTSTVNDAVTDYTVYSCRFGVLSGATILHSVNLVGSPNTRFSTSAVPPVIGSVFQQDSTGSRFNGTVYMPNCLAPNGLNLGIQSFLGAYDAAVRGYGSTDLGCTSSYDQNLYCRSAVTVGGQFSVSANAPDTNEPSLLSLCEIRDIDGNVANVIPPAPDGVPFPGSQLYFRGNFFGPVYDEEEGDFDVRTDITA